MNNKVRHIPPAILHEYNLDPIDVSPNRGVVKIVTKRGTFAVKRTQANSSQLESTYHLMSQLGQKSCLFPFVHNKFGDPFVLDWDENWYVTSWIEEGTRSLRSSNEGAYFMEMCGRLHSHSQLITDLKPLHISIGERFIEYWNRQVQSLEQWLALYEDATHSIDYSLRYIHKKSTEALETIQSQYRGHDEGWLEQFTFCHGRIHPSNTVRVDNNIMLIDFDHCSYDHPTRDIAVFFRGQLPKFYWNTHVGSQWLRSYESVHPLTKEGKKYLAVLLMFPQRLITFFTQATNGARGNVSWKQQFERLFTDYHYMQKFANQLYDI